MMHRPRPSLSTLGFLTACLVSGVAGAVPIQVETGNGWSHDPEARVEGWNDDGVVYLRGAVFGGTSPIFGMLPPELRPGFAVLPIALCDGRIGSLQIDSAGQMFVLGEAVDYGGGPCRVSLDGVSFVANKFLYRLSLENGWTDSSFGLVEPGHHQIDDLVRLRGGARGGLTDTISRLLGIAPSLLFFRPEANVYLPTSLCTDRRGRLRIQPSGEVRVEARSGDFSDAQCSTSLDGARFVLDATNAVPLPLLNGWSGAARSTAPASIVMTKGVVHFRGGVAGGTDPTIAVLPPGMRPATPAVVPVDLCDGADGTLTIWPTGEIDVQASAGLPTASCFTSLDGASFIVDPNRFVSALPPVWSGWVGGPPGTGTPAAVEYGGIVHLKGAVAHGTRTTLLALPVTMRPATNVYVAVDLCTGERGRILVTPAGWVVVEPARSFDDAQCLTSLDGVTFASADAAPGFTALKLQNGWLPAPLGTSPPAAAQVDGLVHMKGAVASGTSGAITRLPRGMRPAANVDLPTTLCNSRKGRIRVSKTGRVFVTAESAFSDAQCFTSLDGLKFARSTAGYAPLTLQNGWLASRSGAYAPGARRHAEVAYLQGAIEAGTGNPAFTLPPALRPQADVVLPVDLCSATKGTLRIESATGDAHVLASPGVPFSDAQCSTSLEGASFAVPEPAGVAALVSGLSLLACLFRVREPKSRRS